MTRAPVMAPIFQATVGADVLSGKWPIRSDTEPDSRRSTDQTGRPPFSCSCATRTCWMEPNAPINLPLRVTARDSRSNTINARPQRRESPTGDAASISRNSSRRRPGIIEPGDAWNASTGGFRRPQTSTARSPCCRKRSGIVGGREHAWRASRRRHGSALGLQQAGLLRYRRGLRGPQKRVDRLLPDPRYSAALRLHRDR